ncbi:hypothetical protein BN903_19 [Halorubrum sp. AJ67]|nr:hypothetical protein BN903_19 [Halorubrum sp. AJ67]
MLIPNTSLKTYLNGTTSHMRLSSAQEDTSPFSTLGVSTEVVGTTERA